MKKLIGAMFVLMLFVGCKCNENFCEDLKANGIMFDGCECE